MAGRVYAPSGAEDEENSLREARAPHADLTATSLSTGCDL